jgi:phage tail-like protein
MPIFGGNTVKSAIIVIALLLATSLFASSPAPVAFTYQGRLFSSGDPVDGLYTMTFKAYDSVTGGTQVGPTITNIRVTVTNGYFQQLLNFGSDLPRGVRIWLEITVKEYHTIELAAVLTPRHELTPAPIALYAQKAGALAPDSAMINHVVRLDIAGRGTFYFAQILGFDPQTDAVEYTDGEDHVVRLRPGRTTVPEFQLVRYATSDNTFWLWKNQLIMGSTPADCDLYIIDTRTGIATDAWHLTNAWPSQLILESDDQAKSVLEKISFAAESVQPLTTGSAVSWARPPAAMIVLPATLTIDAVQNETVEAFTNLGWKFDVVTYTVPPLKRPGNFKGYKPAFTRATTGTSYIPLWYRDVTGGTLVRKSISLPFYNSSQGLVFSLALSDCWPSEIKKTFSGSKDQVIESLAFAVEEYGYSQ